MYFCHIKYSYFDSDFYSSEITLKVTFFFFFWYSGRSVKVTSWKTVACWCLSCYNLTKVVWWREVNLFSKGMDSNPDSATYKQEP